MFSVTCSYETFSFKREFLNVISSLIKKAENLCQRLSPKNMAIGKIFFQEKSRGTYFLGEPKLRVGQVHRQFQCMRAGGGMS